jgi:hypothetical protein
LRLSGDPSLNFTAPSVTTSDGTVVPNASVFMTTPFIVYPDTFVAPLPGLWWNPNESGTGYSLDTNHGAVVATIYSYTLDGLPIWYLASGTIDSNNIVTATLYKYRSGQCISCAYMAPADDGNDGTVTIQFTSPTSAIMTLPGRVPFTIVPEDF